MSGNTLGSAIFTCVVVFGCGWLFYVINSISRAADALERIADALEDDEDDDDEEEDGEE